MVLLAFSMHMSFFHQFHRRWCYYTAFWRVHGSQTASLDNNDCVATSSHMHRAMHWALVQLSSHGESEAWLFTSLCLMRVSVRTGMKAASEDYFLTANVVLSLLQVSVPFMVSSSCYTLSYYARQNEG